MKNYLDKLPRPFFVLAPMDDVTDTVFRQVVKTLAPPDLFFTEFVNVDGLQSPGRTRLIHKLRLSASEGPTIAQIWGLKPENFAKTTDELFDMGFAGVDLNFGCPQKNEIKSGACAALINNRPLAGEIIDATKAGAKGRFPVSVKTRLGYENVDFSWHEFLFGKKLNMLTVHGRTKREMSKVPAHWEDIGTIRQLRDQLAPETLIVGNGDVMDRDQAVDLAKRYELDGVMVGRGIFHNPLLFDATKEWSAKTPKEKLEIYKDHVALFIKTYENREKPIVTLNKFCKTYVNGFDGAKEIRDSLMHATSAKDLQARIDQAITLTS